MSIPREHCWPADRAAARVELKQWRQRLDDNQYRAFSWTIGAHVQNYLQAWLSDRPARNSQPVLAVYWPIRHEPDLRPQFDAWLNLGFDLAVPVTPEARGPLRFARWVPGATMTKDAAGIAVPQSPHWLEPQVVLIPCLGFDASGYRLGYGGGFFDRTLPALGSLNLGVGYHACQLTQFVPNEHDYPLDQIITEQGPVL